MPRKSTLPDGYELQWRRAENYQSHFGKRQLALNLSPEIQSRYAGVCRLLPRPARLNVWGVDDYGYTEVGEAVVLAVRYGLESRLLLPWYWSDEGWADFQAQWSELPELVHTPCVQPSSCTQADARMTLAEKLYTK